MLLLLRSKNSINDKQENGNRKLYTFMFLLYTPTQTRAQAQKKRHRETYTDTEAVSPFYATFEAVRRAFMIY